MSSLQPALLPSLSAIPQGPSKCGMYKQQPISSSVGSSPSGASRAFSSLNFAGSASDGASSPPSSPETDAHPSRANSPPTVGEEADGQEEEDEMSPAPLPSFTVRPKGIAERERERAKGLANGGKKNSMVAQMQRKRADSLKWSKYKNLGSGVIELNLCQDELRRV